MFLSRLRARTCPSTPEEWDSARASLIQSTATGDACEQAAFDAVKTLHRLSLVCFLEAIDPVELSLKPELLHRVQCELNCLQALEPLSAYAAVLEQISINTGSSSGTSEGLDA